MSSSTRPTKSPLHAAEPRATHGRDGAAQKAPLSADESSQIDARLRLSPSDRLRYLEDMIAFEELARRAHRLA